MLLLHFRCVGAPLRRGSSPNMLSTKVSAWAALEAGVTCLVSAGNDVCTGGLHSRRCAHVALKLASPRWAALEPGMRRLACGLRVSNALLGECAMEHIPQCSRPSSTGRQEVGIGHRRHWTDECAAMSKGVLVFLTNFRIELKQVAE